MRWLRKLWRRLKLLFKRKPKKALPRNVQNLTIEIDDMSKNVTATWELPIERVEGGPLAAPDILLIEVRMSADGGAGWSPLVSVPPTDPQSLFIPNLENGDYIFEFTTALLDGQRSDPPLTVGFAVIDDSAPLNVSGVSITFE